MPGLVALSGLDRRSIKKTLLVSPATPAACVLLVCCGIYR
jgi:hypothetical protein